MGLFNNEKPLTFRGLQKHIIYTIVGCFVLALLTGAGTSTAFYYKTNNAIERGIENDEEQDKSINEIKISVQQINSKLGSTNTTTAVSDERIKALEKIIENLQANQQNIQKNQTEMLKILIDINRKY